MNVARRFALAIAVLLSSVAISLPTIAGEPDPRLLSPPSGDDYTHQSLRLYQQQLLQRWGSDRNVPLDVKAEYYTWELWRYHLTSFDQVYNHVLLPDKAGERPRIYPDRDNSTWAGSYLAALSYEYAVKRDRLTLEHIVTFLRGMHFYFEVTGQPGFPARCVNRADGMIDPLMKSSYTAADGTRYLYEADPAKGGFNQIAGGYAALMMLVYPDLPEPAQRLARSDVADLVLHIIDHDYQATHRDGTRSTYGNLTPLVGSVGVPFNAQVAYEIVALGYSFPPDDLARRQRIVDQFNRLRGKHHVYYEEPWSLVQPQRAGVSLFIKGGNDRNHLVNAAFFGLALELDFARRHGIDFNAKFVHQLGQTLRLTMEHPDMQRHALGAFMWAGLAQNPRVFDAIVTHHPNTARAHIEEGLVNGVEQLRRFKLDRWVYPGRVHETRDFYWIDQWRPDDTYWKEDPHMAFEATGASTNQCFCAMDFLYAYWLFRYYKLDEQPVLKSGKPKAES
jgi:hypothetical protein